MGLSRLRLNRSLGDLGGIHVNLESRERQETPSARRMLTQTGAPSDGGVLAYRTSFLCCVKRHITRAACAA